MQRIGLFNSNYYILLLLLYMPNKTSKVDTVQHFLAAWLTSLRILDP